MEVDDFDAAVNFVKAVEEQARKANQAMTDLEVPGV